MPEDCPCTGTYGEVLEQRNVAGFVLTDNQYPRGLELPKHFHNHAYLSFVLDRPYLETYAGSTVVCAPRALRYLPPQEPHANQFETGSHCLLVEIAPAVLERIRGEQPVLDRPGEITGIASTWLAERLISEFHDPDDVSAVAIEGILLEILAEGARNSAHGGSLQAVPRWLRMARQFIEDNYLKPVNLVEIAGAAGVHRVHLSREFRRYFDCTVGEFIRRRRIEHACNLVAKSDKALAEIAVACGFSDQSHFSATFRRLVGVTPARYRQMAR
jgi:AraC family transcriptional regulator